MGIEAIGKFANKKGKQVAAGYKRRAVDYLNRSSAEEEELRQRREQGLPETERFTRNFGDTKSKIQGLMDKTKFKEYGPDELKKKVLKKAYDKFVPESAKNKVNSLLDKVGGPESLQKLHKLAYMDRDTAKEEAKKYLNKEGKKIIRDQVEKRFGKKVASEGAEKLAKSAGKKIAKEGTEKLAKEGAKKVAKQVTKEVTKQVVKQGAKVATEAAVEAGVEGALVGAGTLAAAPTAGISFVLGTLLAMAISLGISDAIDAMIEFAKGNIPKGMHLSIRAATKVALFIAALLIGGLFSALIPGIGVLIGVAIVCLLGDLYWLISSLPFFKDLAIFQGLAKWEKVVLAITSFNIVMAIFTFIFLVVFTFCAFGGAFAGEQAGGGIVGGIVGKISDAFIQQFTFCKDLNLSNLLNEGGSKTNTNSEVGAGTGETGDVQGNGVTCNAGKDTRTGDHAICAPQAAWDQELVRSSTAEGLDPNFVRAIINQESNWRPKAASQYAGGLMQVIPATAAGMGCASDYRTNPISSIQCGTKYLGRIKRGQEGGPPANTRREIAAAYNAGPGRLRPSPNCPGKQVWECPFDNPGHTTCNKGFEETRNYVVSVERFYQEYGQLTTCNNNP